MTQHYFQDDQDYQQSAIAWVALAVYEEACDVISDGNIADISEQTLFQLIEVAKAKRFDLGTKNAIAMYANIVQDENQQMKQHRI